MSETTIPTIESDIADLERQLEEKKAALGHEKSEKEVLHEVVGDRIKEHLPTYSPPLPNVTTPSIQQVEPPSYLSQDLKDKIQSLVDLVFSKNLEEGIKEAAKSGNPSLMDAFHDILTDELYDKLIENRKLDKVE